MLVLCGIPTLGADVCSGLPTSPPKQSLELPREPVSFALLVKSGGPAFRITVRPMWQRKGERVIIVDGHSGEVEVARCADGKPLQLLPIVTDFPINGYTFHADDINFDGYLDFSVVREFAASSGFLRSYWVYDPGPQLFVESELTRELGEWWGFTDFNAAKHEITRRYFGLMRGCPATGEGEEERYFVDNDRLALIHKREVRHDVQSCTVTDSDLVGGVMRVTGVRRFDLQGQPVK